MLRCRDLFDEAVLKVSLEYLSMWITISAGRSFGFGVLWVEIAPWMSAWVVVARRGVGREENGMGRDIFWSSEKERVRVAWGGAGAGDDVREVGEEEDEGRMRGWAAGEVDVVASGMMGSIAREAGDRRSETSHKLLDETGENDGELQRASLRRMSGV
jgi:hypothetical protein